MSDKLYHGSTKKLKRLKPMGWSRHIKENTIYFTDSVDLAATHALNYRWDRFASINVYNFEKQSWDFFYVLRSSKTQAGYIYEAYAPDAVLVDCLDMETGCNVPIEKHKLPNVIGGFVSKKDCEFSARHVVNYDFLKNNCIHIKVFALKKGKHFKKAIKKIEQLAAQTETTDRKEYEKKMKALNKLLEKYTEKQ